MNLLLKWFCVLLIFFLFISMSDSQDKNTIENPIEKLSWIVDRWVSNDEESITYENWEMEDDTTFSGESYTVKNGDTVFNEQLKIEKIAEDVYYTAIVKHNPDPVHFKLVELGENKVVFENPEHDFPNKIMYMLKKDGSLYARIEGKNKKGEDVTGEFFYKRAR
jgi:Domain of unknown function (DUF6265)